MLTLAWQAPHGASTTDMLTHGCAFIHGLPTQMASICIILGTDDTDFGPFHTSAILVPCIWEMILKIHHHVWQYLRISTHSFKMPLYNTIKKQVTCHVWWYDKSSCININNLTHSSISCCRGGRGWNKSVIPTAAVLPWKSPRKMICHISWQHAQSNHIKARVSSMRGDYHGDFTSRPWIRCVIRLSVTRTAGEFIHKWSD